MLRSRSDAPVTSHSLHIVGNIVSIIASERMLRPMSKLDGAFRGRTNRELEGQWYATVECSLLIGRGQTKQALDRSGAFCIFGAGVSNPHLTYVLKVRQYRGKTRNEFSSKFPLTAGRHSFRLLTSPCYFSTSLDITTPEFGTLLSPSGEFRFSA